MKDRRLEVFEVVLCSFKTLGYYLLGLFIVGKWSYIKGIPKLLILWLIIIITAECLHNLYKLISNFYSTNDKSKLRQTGKVIFMIFGFGLVFGYLILVNFLVV